MKNTYKKFNAKDMELIKSEPVYNGFFNITRLTLRHRLFDGGWSGLFQRELLDRGTSVGVLLYDPEHSLVGLVEQFRVGALTQQDGPWLFEIVAGMVDKGETTEAVARREVLEEAGIASMQLLPICDYWVSPGGSSERITLFCALTDLTGAGGSFGLQQESEDILLHVLAIEEVFLWLDQGWCNNAATTISLMWLRSNYGNLKYKT